MAKICCCLFCLIKRSRKCYWRRAEVEITPGHRTWLNVFATWSVVTFSNFKLCDCNGTRTHYHLVCKRTLNHLAKLTKWLNWVVSTYLYGAFDCIILLCHVRGSEWIHTLHLPECQGTPCSKQGQYLKFNWLKVGLSGFESHCSHLNFR